MPEVVYANTTTHIGWGPDAVFIEEGSVWAADDPLVRERPAFFSKEPTRVHRTVPKRPVEDTTAEPGKKRSLR